MMNHIDKLEYNIVHLDKIQVALKKIVPNNVGINLDWNVYEDVAKNMIIELTSFIAKETLLDETIKYPSNWWEALKERWLPIWAKKLRPIKYTTKHFNAIAIYPKISIPDDGPIIKMIIK